MVRLALSLATLSVAGCIGAQYPPLRPGGTPGRTSEEILAAMLVIKSDMASCATDGRTKESRSGKVVVDFTILPDGTVANIEIVSQDTADTVFARCLRDVALPRLKFKPAELSGEVRFPFLF